MSTFRFADLRADVYRIGPAEDPSLDVYGVKLTDPEERWIETRVVAPRGKPRTTANDFDLAYIALQSIYAATTRPEEWKAAQRGEVSDLELDATAEAAQGMELWLGPAVDVAESRWDLYEEGREGGVGPIEMSGGRG
jgi:hypothetical protein